MKTSQRPLKQHPQIIIDKQKQNIPDKISCYNLKITQSVKLLSIRQQRSNLSLST